MPHILPRERRLCRQLCNFPRKHEFRYNEGVAHELKELLFRALMAENDEYLDELFLRDIPVGNRDWVLGTAQGRLDGVEYTEAARGKPCGHIFKQGHLSFRCKTCSDDDTSALCMRCFEATDHKGHVVYRSMSSGNTGCCDCGDEEAWKRKLNCSIHTRNDSTDIDMDEHDQSKNELPELLCESIPMAIGRAMDYVIDVLSCSPENLRLPKTEADIRQDEKQSRLQSSWYDEHDALASEAHSEFALVLWNDEKHTILEVESQVARACDMSRDFGRIKAEETDEYGRTIVYYSSNLPKLLSTAAIIEQIRITVTVRSSRDTFRESMCGTIFDWLSDLAGCSFGSHHDVFRQAICHEFLKSWQPGSLAVNQNVAQNGLDDHEIEDHGNLLQGSQHRALLRTLLDQRAVMVGDADTNDLLEAEERFDDAGMLTDEPGGMDDDPLGINDLSDTEVAAQFEDVIEEDESEGDQADVLPELVQWHGQMELDDDMSEHGEPRQQSSHTQQDPVPQRTALDSTTTAQPEDEDHQGDSQYEAPDHLTRRIRLEIPKVKNQSVPTSSSRPPEYWLPVSKQLQGQDGNLPNVEDLRQKLRLDWLLLYDLRLWKCARVALRDLYIKTLVSVPSMKRIFGLRFAGLYNVLGQLYLVADREPELSIVNLSLQFFTTPSITGEIIEKANFLSTVFAMLYTFLTQRNVQHPWQVSLVETSGLSPITITNRRTYHFFSDIKYLCAIPLVQQHFRENEHYQLQLLDLFRLSQGICPTIRAVREHVQYEDDVWLSAQMLTRETNRLCRQFGEAFCQERCSPTLLLAALRNVARATATYSLGAERRRFPKAEIQAEMSFKRSYLQSLDSEDISNESSPDDCATVDFVIAKENMSFHHPLHYTLSWLIECAKELPIEDIRAAMVFTFDELQHVTPTQCAVPNRHASDYIMAIFDFPIRIHAWLAQMRAGLWVRNGLSLRHQMASYISAAHREYGYQRDLFLLQTAFVVAEPSRVLEAVVDRYGLTSWLADDCLDDIDLLQLLSLVEDLIHLLIICLSDRLLLCPGSPKDREVHLVENEVAHILCFGPMSFSDLDARFLDRTVTLDDHQDVLAKMTNYRGPQGLTENGIFELKPEYLALVDPYTVRFNKTQRDEAEQILREWKSKETGLPPDDVAHEPCLAPIHAGIFRLLPQLTTTSIFINLIIEGLESIRTASMIQIAPQIRLESLQNSILHLILIALMEDNSVEAVDSNASKRFSSLAMTYRCPGGRTICQLLLSILTSEKSGGSQAKSKLILSRLKSREPAAFSSALAASGCDQEKLKLDLLETKSATSAGPQERGVQDHETSLKKEQALERQRKIMAQMRQQQDEFLANQDQAEEDTLEEDDEVCTSHADVDESRKWALPHGECILCQEPTNKGGIYGTFSLMIMTGRPEVDDDVEKSIQTILETPRDLCRGGRTRSQQSQPILPQPLSLNWHARPVQRPISTGCGHIMHFHCFERYYVATAQRHQFQIARQHPERIESKEFVCPLCKTLGNAFLPIIPTISEENVEPLVTSGAVEEDLIDWLQSRIGPAGSRFFKSSVDKIDESVLRDTLWKYVDNPQMSAGRNEGERMRRQRSRERRASPENDHQEQVSINLEWITGYRDPTTPEPEELPDHFSVQDELNAALSRLNATLLKNEIITERKNALNALIDVFANAVENAEIVQRGSSNSNSLNLLQDIPVATRAHLRLLAESVKIFMAVGVLKHPNLGVTSKQCFAVVENCMESIFLGHPQLTIEEDQLWGGAAPVPAMSFESIDLLTRCCSLVALWLRVEPLQFVRLLYVLEAVKATCIYVPFIYQSMWAGGDPAQATDDEEMKDQPDPQFIHLVERLHDIWFSIYGSVGIKKPRPISRTIWLYGVSTLSLLRRLVYMHTLTYLRQATVLFSVLQGKDVPDHFDDDVKTTEHAHLSRMLSLPSTDQLLQQLEPGKILHRMVRAWIHHHDICTKQWQQPHHFRLQKSDEYRSDAKITLSRPVIYELVQLPHSFDTLAYEMTRHICPSKCEGPLTDPSLCLFCGMYLCSQALCCSNNNEGGCNRHMRRCGRNVGLFLNIRKCMVLYLHDGHGSWNTAPYLDRYGEPDPGLRRGRQLILSQTRYDKLYRDAWLQQGIPTVIARRLDAEINNGGWETI